MAATIPVNITGLALLQTRMVAGIAHLRGYDLDDPRVRNAILLCTLGEDTVRELVKKKKIPGTPWVIATAPAHDPELETVVAGEVTSALVNRVVGKRAAGTVIRRIPLAGGVWGGSADAFATWQVGKYAARELRSRTITPRVAPPRAAGADRTRSQPEQRGVTEGRDGGDRPGRTSLDQERPGRDQERDRDGPHHRELGRPPVNGRPSAAAAGASSRRSQNDGARAVAPTRRTRSRA